MKFEMKWCAAVLEDGECHLTVSYDDKTDTFDIFEPETDDGYELDREDAEKLVAFLQYCLEN